MPTGHWNTENNWKSTHHIHLVTYQILNQFLQGNKNSNSSHAAIQLIIHILVIFKLSNQI